MKKKGEIMKRDSGLKKFNRVNPKRVDPHAVTTMISFEMDTNDISRLKDEVDHLGISHLILLKSIIHRFLNGELVDSSEVKKIGTEKAM